MPRKSTAQQPDDARLTVFTDRLRPAIDATLTSILQQYEQAAAKGTEYQALWAAIRQLVLRGGKRLRPLLCLLAYEGYGGTDEAAILPVAAGLELLHAFFLMHDDVIDRDLTRWNGPNITGAYLAELKRQLPPAEARHYAESYAILAGDLCAELATTLLLDSNFSAPRRLQALTIFQNAIRQTLAGEVMDVAYGLGAHQPKQDELLDLYRQKTAAYTFCAPLQIGAVLAGAPQNQLRILAKVAVNLGIAFQLQDDILGIFGEEAVTGKSNLSDLREGKRTLLIVKGLALATAADRQLLERFLGNPEAGRAELLQVRTILQRCGAAAAIEKLVEQYLQSALQDLTACNLRSHSQERLRAFIAWLTTRTA